MAGGCSFLGSLYVIECGRGSLALVLDGLPEFHDRAQLEDERLGSECAEAMGRAVLERIASELSTRSARLGAPTRKLTAHGMQPAPRTRGRRNEIVKMNGGRSSFALRNKHLP